jgi:hypothetical protein
MTNVILESIYSDGSTNKISKGGRGNKAHYETTHVRIPVELKELVNRLSDEFKLTGNVPTIKRVNSFNHDPVVAPLVDTTAQDESIESLPIIEAIDKAVNSFNPKITYRLANDGCVVLKSLKGVIVKDLKRMDDKQLKDIGLYRDQIALRTKYYPIYFEL